LKPGTYELHVSGTADVAWREPSFVQTGAPRPAFTRSITEPVEGATIDRTLALTITAASEEALSAAYAPYLAAAESFSRAGREAVNGILEMAPAFLEPAIRTLVKQRGHERGFADAAAEALAEINTPSSRAELIDWFDRSDDLQIRSSIVNAVARARHPDNLPFLASLLPGRSTQVDNRIRRDAALGIGMIGGEAAVEALRDAARSPDPLVTGAVLLALGNTQSKSAIPILIERAEGQKGYVSNDVCNALIALTHLGWCGGVGLEETQKKWRMWWVANAKDVRVYSPDDCPDRSTLPHIW
jgi:HEAT repeat protein